MRTRPVLAAVAYLCLLGVAHTAIAKDLILTAPPREKPEAGIKQYTPLAEHLTKLLGKKVVYEHPGNWLNYQRDMRADKYDVVFSGPHFASWRIEHLGHKVLVKLPGFLQFHLVTRKEFTDINKPEDLVAKRICSIPPPNLSILSVLAAYQNPVQQPVLKGVKGGMGGVYKTFKDESADCQAWSFRTTFYNKKLKDEDRAKMKILYSTPKLPNQSITVSKRLSERDQSLMLQSITLGDGVKATAPILRRFGGKAKAFIPAKQEEFKGHNLLLEGVIFGW